MKETIHKLLKSKYLMTVILVVILLILIVIGSKERVKIQTGDILIELNDDTMKMPRKDFKKELQINKDTEAKK